MKLSTRLGLIVGCAALGALILVFISLQTIRSSMLTDRQEQIRSTVNLAAKQVGVYVGLEKAGAMSRDDSSRLLKGATVRFGDVADPTSLARDGFQGERFDAVVSCLASRTGAPRDAWAIDHQANLHALAAAQAAGARQFVLLSAICVQKPLLAFQQRAAPRC